MKPWLAQVTRIGDFEQVGRLIAAASNPRDKAFIALLARTGTRISEAIQLKEGNIDFKSGTLTIVHLKSRLKFFCPHCQARLGKSHRFCSWCGREVAEPLAKTHEGRRQRPLPLDPDTLAMLEDFIHRDGTEGLVFGINRHQAWQIVRDRASKASLQKLVNPETGRVRGVSPHRLRDAFAVHALKLDDSGDGLRLLQEQLGHASFNTTARYRKVAGEEHRERYERLWQEEGHAFEASQGRIPQTLRVR